MKKLKLVVGMLLLSSTAVAQTPQWNVTLTPTLNPLPIGLCGAVHLTLMDPATKDVPRNPKGQRITMADFDLTISGTAIAGHQIDASHFEACGCQSGVIGTTATITAKYPAQFLPAAARVPGIAFQKTATVKLDTSKGSVNPQSCVTLVSNTPESAAAPSSAGLTNGQPISTVPNTRVPGNTVPPAPVVPAATVVPVNPSNLNAFEGQPGEVVLQWDPVDDAEYYVAFGPGLEGGGQRVEQGNLWLFWPGQNKMGQAAFEVPGGMQEWAVASYYPGNVTTPGSEFSRVSLNVRGVAATTPASPTPSQPPAAVAASGKYSITMVGIRVYQASTDDMLSRDGTGDEIYAAAFVRSYDRRNGSLKNSYSAKTEPHGDNFHFPERIQAGSSTATGGLRDGDMLPGPGLIAMRSVPRQSMTFPFALWEGTMTDGVDALVISPSIWEQDVGDGFFAKWKQFQQTLNITLFAKQVVQDQIAQQAFGPVVFGASPNDTNTAIVSNAKLGADTLLMMFGGAIPIMSLTTTTQDRAIGLQQNTRDSSVLPNPTVVLTREIIEKALASPALGAIPSPIANAPSALHTPAIARIGVVAPKPGIIVVDFQDKDMLGAVGIPERPAIYQMYIQVERVP